MMALPFAESLELPGPARVDGHSTAGCTARHDRASGTRWPGRIFHDRRSVAVGTGLEVRGRGSHDEYWPASSAARAVGGLPAWVAPAFSVPARVCTVDVAQLLESLLGGAGLVLD
jgi:hypothetical protein